MFTENRWSKEFFCSVKVWLFMRDQMYFLLSIIPFIDYTDGRGRILPQEYTRNRPPDSLMVLRKCRPWNTWHFSDWPLTPPFDELRAKRQQSSVYPPPPTHTFFYESMYKHAPVQFLLILMFNNLKWINNMKIKTMFIKKFFTHIHVAQIHACHYMLCFYWNTFNGYWTDIIL